MDDKDVLNMIEDQQSDYDDAIEEKMLEIAIEEIKEKKDVIGKKTFVKRKIVIKDDEKETKVQFDWKNSIKRDKNERKAMYKARYIITELVANSNINNTSDIIMIGRIITNIKWKNVKYNEEIMYIINKYTIFNQ